VRSETATARLTSSAVTESRCSFVYAIAAETIGFCDVGRLSGASWSSASDTRSAKVRKKPSETSSPSGRSMGQRKA
jgi:hypothetical protein